MKTEELIVLGLAGLAVYFIVSGKKMPTAIAAVSNWKQSYSVDEILNTAQPGQIGYGWRNFSDGTSIGPDGKYYLNGQYIPGT